ncbi:SusC/RagA family TonB-linked outer membrane protein [Hymenobacter wooponensis]|uniref:SusC/RagA family TonB-linked outer membrane protein n=1 Tax=Hymenobacter wooponensis TaxID=1525360 RepID=A0A4Z0MH11_9BACT|nr:SusC/RagA family TonB-linked outer membrane protein [Hymenobacter wooponensis]TGD78759.1 SusC/RagA family TonB-linked outer membrane protein [Hymenobacter wooponensis]
MKKLLWSPLALGVLLASPPSYAQTAATRTMTGVVVGSNDQQPIPGVNVLVKGSSQGTQTDAEGRYTLPNVPEGSTLVFSFIGYTSQEYRLGTGTTANINLAPDSKSLSEVVVTGYGIKEEQGKINYAVQVVKDKDIIESRQPNIVNALQGKVAGVQVTSSGGAPGEGAAIVIRGGNSLDGNNQPLFVIDGIIMDNSSFAESTAPGGGSAFNGTLGRSTSNQNRAGDLNPENIESMTVLKGPAASAIYGLRAANGAVVITTKKGTKGAINLNYRTQFSVDEVNRRPQLQDQYQQGSNGVFDTSVRSSWGPRFQPGQTVYDNLGNFFRPGKAWQHYLTLSGGGDKGTFFVSASRLDQTGVAPTSQYDKSTVRLSGTMQFTKRLSASGSVEYLGTGGQAPIQGNGFYNTSGYTGGYLLSLLNWPRNDDARNYLNPDGSVRRLTPQLATESDNPYFIVYKNPQTSRTNRMLGNVQLGFKAADWLNFSYNIGNDFYFQKDRSVRALGTNQPGYQNGGVAESNIFSQLITSNLLATATHQFSENFNTSLVLGNTVEYQHRETTDQLGTVFQNPDFPSINNTVNRNALVTTQDRRLIGNFARLSLDFLQQFTVELNGRIDQSSTLPRPNENKTFGKLFGYGSASAGWQFTHMLGLDQNEYLSFGKIRAAVADVGKDTEPYRVLSPLAQSAYIGGGFRNGFFGSNPNLVPERTRAVEGGLDLQFFKNRLGLNATYYYQITRDQIIGPRVSQATGFILQYINAGKVENRGFELALSGTPVQNSTGFTWDVLANFTLNRNKALELPSFLTEVYQSDVNLNGARGGAFVGRPISSISATDFQRAPDGRVLINATTGYPLINTSNFIYAGNRAPDYSVQVTNTFSYKGLVFAFLADFRKGGKVFNGNDQYLTTSGLGQRTEERYKQVVFDGVVATKAPDGSTAYVTNTRPVELTQGYYQNVLAAIGTPFIEDGSWVRLRYASLTYNLPTTWLSESTFIKGVELNVTGRNLVLLTKYSGVDPETASAGAGVRGGGSGGFDYGSVPATRGVDMGLRVKF